MHSEEKRKNPDYLFLENQTEALTQPWNEPSVPAASVSSCFFGILFLISSSATEFSISCFGTLGKRDSETVTGMSNSSRFVLMTIYQLFAVQRIKKHFFCKKSVRGSCAGHCELLQSRSRLCPSPWNAGMAGKGQVLYSGNVFLPFFTPWSSAIEEITRLNFTFLSLVRRMRITQSLVSSSVVHSKMFSSRIHRKSFPPKCFPVVCGFSSYPNRHSVLRAWSLRGLSLESCGR